SVLVAVDGDRADQFILIEHGDHEKGPNATKFDGRDDIWDPLDIRPLRCEIGDMNGLFRLNHAGCSCVRTGTKWSELSCFDECGGHIVKCDRAKRISVVEVH